MGVHNDVFKEFQLQYFISGQTGKSNINFIELRTWKTAGAKSISNIALAITRNRNQTKFVKSAWMAITLPRHHATNMCTLLAAFNDDNDDDDDYDDDDNY